MTAAAPIEVSIASPLVSYTGTDKVQALGETLGDVLNDLDARFPGIRFRMIDEQDRIRKHIRIFINDEQVRDLAQSVRPADQVWIVQALSGG